MSLLGIGLAPLELNTLVAALGNDAGTDGAVVTFLGLVRNHNAGRRVRYLEYEAFEPLNLAVPLGDDRMEHPGRSEAGRAA